MLRISKLADYGTEVVSAMAKRGARRSSAQDLAEATQIPRSTVSKVLKLLKKADLVSSSRGAGGGYHLNRLASDISIADIVAAIDEPPALTACCVHDNACDRAAECVVKPTWQTINERVLSVLSEYKVADLK